MKVVVLGDIHANLPALRRALLEADAEGYDRILHAGDLVGLGPHPNEVVDLVLSRGIEGVRGDHDDLLAAGEDEPRAAMGDAAEARLAAEALRWTKRRLSLPSRRALADLPFELRLSSGAATLALYHANPVDLRTALLPETPEPRLEAAASAAGADVTVVGHSHRPFHRDLVGRHVVGAGSVGSPRDGDPRTGYAVIRMDGLIEISHRRFEYDVEAAVMDARAAGLPERLGEAYRAGR